MASLVGLAGWLAASPLTTAATPLVTARAWIVPALQVVHIVGIAVVVIATALINLRTLGLIDADRPQRQVQAVWFPVLACAIVVLALTGYLLIASEPARALFRTVFWVKLGLIVLALVVTGVQGRLARRADVAPPTARLLAVAAGLLWVGVIFAGRWIAYADAWPGASA